MNGYWYILEMKKITIIGMVFIVITLLSTAYGFSAMLGVRVKLIHEPFNLLLCGFLMVAMAHCLRQFLPK